VSIIISIHPEFANQIRKGNKTVEVRRRSVNIPSGSRLWVYETLPSGKVEFCVVVDYVYKGTPSEIWDKYSSKIGIEADRFFEYFAGCNYGSAIIVDQVKVLEKSISLTEIKSFGYKSIPQTYRKLEADDALYHLLNKMAKV
jgi:predicted transcriptional regulator